MAVNSAGEPLPWYTYPAIEYLDSFDFSECDVFEFGAGNSSLYWASKAKQVTSVEDDEAWFNHVIQSRLPNQDIVLGRTAEAYIGALAQQGRLFDIIVIDGNHRLECTMAAMDHLHPDGIVVLDNSDRVIEKECARRLRANQFIQVDFSGFGPVNDYCWSTSIFLRTSRLFSRGFAGPDPIGGLKN